MSFWNASKISMRWACRIAVLWCSLSSRCSSADSRCCDDISKQCQSAATIVKSRSQRTSDQRAWTIARSRRETSLQRSCLIMWSDDLALKGSSTNCWAEVSERCSSIVVSRSTDLQNMSELRRNEHSRSLSYRLRVSGISRCWHDVCSIARMCRRTASWSLNRSSNSDLKRAKRLSCDDAIRRSCEAFCEINVDDDTTEFCDRARSRHSVKRTTENQSNDMRRSRARKRALENWYKDFSRHESRFALRIVKNERRSTRHSSLSLQIVIAAADSLNEMWRPARDVAVIELHEMSECDDPVTA